MKEVHQGDRFGRLLVTGAVYSLPTRRSQKRVVDCLCDCGTPKKAVSIYLLLTGHTSSCGCLRREVTGSLNVSHAESGTHLHEVWRSMHRRCASDTERNRHYAGKGIQVCEEWDTFEPFRDWALANGYSSELWIDRKDGNENYSPGNCRFVTPTESARNTSRNRLVTAFGETKVLCEWPEDSRCPVDAAVIGQRLNESAWSEQDAVATPLGAKRKDDRYVTAFRETKPFREWVRDPRCVVARRTLWQRLFETGWDAEKALSTPAGPNGKR